MGILSFLGMGGEAKGVIEALSDAGDKIFTSDEERAQWEATLTKIAQKPHLMQAEINKIEAGHRSIFVAGWRPFIGWVCGFSLGAYFIPKFALASILWIKVSWMAQSLQHYPVDGADLMQIIFALLGLGGLRTVEKLNGKTK